LIVVLHYHAFSESSMLIPFFDNLILLW